MLHHSIVTHPMKNSIMTSSMRHRKGPDELSDNDHVTCGCQRHYKSGDAYHNRSDAHRKGLSETNRDLLRLQIDGSCVVTSSNGLFQPRKKKRRLEAPNISSFCRFCTNIFPKISLWKIILVVHLFTMLNQINKCESSAKWWSIASIPTSAISPLYSRRQQRHHSTLIASYKTESTEDTDSILTKDKIKEILATSDINSLETADGEGSFTNQNKRDANSRAIETSQKRNKLLLNSFSTNLNPPTLADQRVQVLSKKQRRLLRKNAGALEEIIIGLKKAVKECKYQFRNRRWICQTDARDSSLFGKILHRGFRETAFIYAITSAAVSHSIATGCSQGRIASCGCHHKRGQGGPGWEWGGCSDNFQFARKFARDFVDAGEIGNDLKYRVNLHNNKVGRQLVEDESRRLCKCHGMSGSCTLKTCWLRAAAFRTIGRKLKDKFDDAERVSMSNHGTVGKRSRGLLPAIRGRKPPKKDDLVYYENSPSFCVKDSEFWAAGTRGRSCNSTSNGLNGCDSICCGRGFRTRVKTVKQKCKCEFEWCCRVNCQICEVEKEISTCR